jgi:hypothetical protein
MGKERIKGIIHQINLRRSLIAHVLLGFTFAHLVNWVNVWLLFIIISCLVTIKESIDSELYKEHGGVIPLYHISQYLIGFIMYLTYHKVMYGL